MKVKLLKAYSLFCAGDVLDLDIGVAELLIGRGIAEEYREPQGWHKALNQPEPARRERNGRR